MRFSHQGIWSLFLIALFVGPIACKGVSKSKPDPSLAFRHSKTEKPAASGGVADIRCPGAERFSDPGVEDPEYPLAEIYRAALMPDGDEAFKRFSSQFASSLDARFLREQQWPRVRKHVRKYIQDPEDFAFELCRREVKVDGSIKVFVRSYDERKSNPPCTLAQDGNQWKVKFFSY